MYNDRKEEDMALLKISAKGWVVIPADLRQKYGLKPGMQVRIVDYGGVLALVPLLKDPIKQAAGMLKGGPSLTQAIIDEHAREIARDS
jgi:AbrB family looped-hinge helix DNA binding protein